jgi:hypothetical protein
MAQDFDKPIPADLEIATRLQNERDMNVALAKGSTSSALGKPVGALDFSAPNSYNRTLTQYNGSAYVGFNLRVDTLTAVSGVVDLNSSGAQLTSDSIQTVLYGGSGGNYLQYVKATNQWYLVVGGSVRLKIETANIAFFSQNLGTAAGASSSIANFENYNGNSSPLLVTAERSAAGADWTTASTRLQKKVDFTFMGYVDFNGSNNPSGVTIGAGLSATAQGVPAVLRVLQSGRTLVGADVVDDGVTGLQVTSIRATKQPGVVNIFGPSTSVAASTDVVVSMTGANFLSGATISGNRITFTRGGRLTFSGAVAFVCTSANFPVFLTLRDNGSSAVVAQNRTAIGNDATLAFSYTTEVFAGDYLELSIRCQGASGSANIVAGTSAIQF